MQADPTHPNIGLYLKKRAQLNSKLDAIIDYASGRRYTFEKADRRADAVANALLRLGVSKGDRIALLLMNSSEFFEVFFGAARIGAIIVPLNWRLIADELIYILKDSGATIIFFSNEFREIIDDIHNRGISETDLSHWIEVHANETSQRFAKNFEDFISKTQQESNWVATSEEDPLFIMYTSGTTGLPKGVLHTHGTIMWALITSTNTADIRFFDRYVIALPMYHVGALIPLLTNVYVGATSVLLRQFDPQLMWRIIDKEKISVTLAVPTMLNMMLEVSGIEKFEFRQLRWIMSGASPVPVNLIKQYKNIGIEIHQVYGLTESGGPGTLIGPDQAMTYIGSAGKGFFHTEVRVVNSSQEDVSPGSSGEVIIRAKHIMKGYWKNPKATESTIRDGWLHTGDLATIDEQGYITIQDRMTDMIISGGENIYPSEVENVLMMHPDITDAAVIGIPSHRWGESPLAIIVTRKNNISEVDIYAHCKKYLARYKCPKGIGYIDSIPRNQTGKALKHILRKKFSGPGKE